MQFSLYNECVTMKRLIQKRITECGNILQKKNTQIWPCTLIITSFVPTKGLAKPWELSHQKDCFSPKKYQTASLRYNEVQQPCKQQQVFQRGNTWNQTTGTSGRAGGVRKTHKKSFLFCLESNCSLFQVDLISISKFYSPALWTKYCKQYSQGIVVF